MLSIILIILLTYHFLLASPSFFPVSHATNSPSAYVSLATVKYHAQGVRERISATTITGDSDPKWKKNKNWHSTAHMGKLLQAPRMYRWSCLPMTNGGWWNRYWRGVRYLCVRLNFYFWNLGFGFGIYLVVFVSGFIFPFQRPIPLWRTKLTNLELILICVYLVCTAFNPCLRLWFRWILDSDVFFGEHAPRVYNQWGWVFFLSFDFHFSSLPILTTDLSKKQGISPTLLYPVPTREEEKGVVDGSGKGREKRVWWTCGVFLRWRV